MHKVRIKKNFLRPAVIMPIIGCGCLALMLFGGLIAVAVFVGEGLLLRFVPGAVEWLKAQNWFTAIEDAGRRLIEQLDAHMLLKYIVG